MTRRSKTISASLSPSPSVPRSPRAAPPTPPPTVAMMTVVAVAAVVAATSPRPTPTSPAPTSMRSTFDLATNMPGKVGDVVNDHHRRDRRWRRPRRLDPRAGHQPDARPAPSRTSSTAPARSSLASSTIASSPSPPTSSTTMILVGHDFGAMAKNFGLNEQIDVTGSAGTYIGQQVRDSAPTSRSTRPRSTSRSPTTTSPTSTIANVGMTLDATNKLTIARAQGPPDLRQGPPHRPRRRHHPAHRSRPPPTSAPCSPTRSTAPPSARITSADASSASAAPAPSPAPAPQASASAPTSSTPRSTPSTAPLSSSTVAGTAKVLDTNDDKQVRHHPDRRLVGHPELRLHPLAPRPRHLLRRAHVTPTPFDARGMSPPRRGWLPGRDNGVSAGFVFGAVRSEVMRSEVMCAAKCAQRSHEDHGATCAAKSCAQRSQVRSEVMKTTGQRVSAYVALARTSAGPRSVRSGPRNCAAKSWRAAKS